MISLRLKQIFNNGRDHFFSPRTNGFLNNKFIFCLTITKQFLFTLKKKMSGINQHT